MIADKRGKDEVVLARMLIRRPPLTTRRIPGCFLLLGRFQAPECETRSRLHAPLAQAYANLHIIQTGLYAAAGEAPLCAFDQRIS